MYTAIHVAFICFMLYNNYKYKKGLLSIDG